MQKKPSPVRLCFTLAVIGLAGAVIGCGENSTPAHPTPFPGAGAVSSSAEGPAAEVAFPVGPELAAVRQATARFHELSAAYSAGYTIPENEPCVADPAGVMGVHAPNPALMGDNALDPLQPELLLYEPRRNGKHKLVGVEYLQFVLVRNPETNEVAPWVSPDFSNPTQWPAHYEVVTPTPQLFGQTFGGPMPGHTPTMPWHWDLHVWIWAHNPSGLFAQWNPALTCD